MKIGTYYYPEQWPRQQWERDFDNIAEMGLQIVHMGEFAWFTMEPAEGDIRLDWLSECVEMAARRKLDVILCTPTAAPPIWLIEKYPDVLMLDQHRTPQRFGGRRHYSPTSPSMRLATQRIVSALAERFATHRSVIGWQIDNEYSGSFGQNDHTHAAFRQWLRARYATIENLNHAWGCQFWNTYYTDFAQILFPPGRNPHYGNPHQCLDASRFWSWAWADFNRLQSRIIQSHLPPQSPQPFITTNLMPFHLDVNPADLADDLSLMSWDMYLVTGHSSDITTQQFRLADPTTIGIVHDQMSSYLGRWGLMEMQPGQVNWSGVPVLLYPGAVRLWLWTAFAHGAEFVTTYRFRQPRFGIELFHHGLIGTDGVSPSEGGREFVQTIEEMRHLDVTKLSAPSASHAALAASPKPPPSTMPETSRRRSGRSKVLKAPGPENVALSPAESDRSVQRPLAPAVGLLMDFEQLWSYATLPQARRWNQPRLLRHWYGAIARLGLRVEILHPDRPWPADLPVLVAPGVQMVDDALVSRLDQFATSGGHLVLTCRTGLMDRNGQLWEGPLAKPILPLICGTIEAYDGLPDDTFATVIMDDKSYRWGVWGDLLYAEPDTKVLARYGDQFYADVAAVIQCRRGLGSVTYCGVFAEGDFEAALMQKITEQAKLPTAALPSRVQVLRRGPYHIVLNYQDTAYDVPARPTARFLVGSARVEPAGVAVWEE